MTRYVINRILVTIPVLLVISIAVFVIVNLPPGDFTTPCLQDPRECPQ